MLDKAMYNSWESRMLLYIKAKKNGRMMLESIENGPLVYPTVEVDGQILKKKYTELTEQEQLQDDCDFQATNIVLQGLPPDVYSLVNHCQSAKVTVLPFDQGRIKMMVSTVSFKPKLINVVALLLTTARLGLVVLVFLPGDDPIACLNKAMAFMSTVVASCFTLTNNQLKTSSNPQNQATIQDGMGETIQLVKQGLLSVMTAKVKGIWQGSILSQKGQGILHGSWKSCCSFKQLAFLVDPRIAFLVDPRIADCHDVQPTIIHNAPFQTDDLDAYDSDCDDISSAKAVLMANLSSYGSNILSEGFEPTKKVVKEEVIPFINSLRASFKDFENGLHNELNEVKTVFNQIEVAVEQCSVDKKYFDIQKKEVSLDNDRLLDHIICQDVMNIVMHVDSVLANVLPTDNKCLVHDNLEIERLEQKNDHLFELLLSQDIVHICVNSLTSCNDYREMKQGFIDEYNKNLMLKAELAKNGQMVEKTIF
ncbi:hypothetical protein Tco_1293379 [Tanacetum coccineum]